MRYFLLGLFTFALGGWIELQLLADLTRPRFADGNLELAAFRFVALNLLCGWAQAALLARTEGGLSLAWGFFAFPLLGLLASHGAYPTLVSTWCGNCNSERWVRAVLIPFASGGVIRLLTASLRKTGRTQAMVERIRS